MASARHIYEDDGEDTAEALLPGGGGAAAASGGLAPSVSPFGPTLLASTGIATPSTHFGSAGSFATHAGGLPSSSPSYVTLFDRQ